VTETIAGATPDAVGQAAETAIPDIEAATRGVATAAAKAADPEPLAEVESKVGLDSAGSAVRQAAGAVSPTSSSVNSVLAAGEPLLGVIDLVGRSEMLDPLLSDGVQPFLPLLTDAVQPLGALQPLEALRTLRRSLPVVELPAMELPAPLVGLGSGTAGRSIPGVVPLAERPIPSAPEHGGPAPLTAGGAPLADARPALLPDPPARKLLGTAGAANGVPSPGILGSVPPAGDRELLRPTPGSPGEGPLPYQRPPSEAPAVGSGFGGSIFIPLVALLALLALAPPASLRRRRSVPDCQAPTPFVCALECPG
jgi:hypothetical protein